MKHGFMQSEAESLVGEVFETTRFLCAVPRGSRGRVIEALDRGDHWNVLIEWERPHLPVRAWYDKFDVQNSMRRLAAQPGITPNGEDKVLEIRSSHDLAALSADARQTGRHSYHISTREFAASLHAWQSDRRQRSRSLALTTLALEKIWITAAETRRVSAIIAAAGAHVTLD